MKMFKTTALAILLATLNAIGIACADEPWSCILPEQRRIQVRSPEQLCPAQIPYSSMPATVENPQWDSNPIQLSLSEVLNLSIQNMDVVRVLTGVNATATGRTIYDPAIINNNIDTARSRFDPEFRVNNRWQPNRNEPYGMNMGLSKRMVTGGVIDFGLTGADRRSALGQDRADGTMSYTQPLLQGAGVAVNQAPIVIARIDAERSYFQFKDSVQNHVQSVIQGYWQLVQARTELWAREQQVKQLEFALKRAETRHEVGDITLGELSQARVAYENFRASLLVAQANILQRESALRNALGLSPYEGNRIIPTSPLIDQKMEINWEELLILAELRRPDIIELKLILEADQQRLLTRNNDALPRLDGVALYRWNGLEGTIPRGNETELGVNFSVPFGLRSGRASLRQQELILDRDRINLQQGLHQASHNLAINVRNLALFYEQYLRFQEVRKAAQVNLDQQLAIGNTLVQFIVLLQAVTDWGNAVSSEAQALVQYNTELAALERETGTILESHNITFAEERFGSIGPRGRLAEPQLYPRSVRPSDSVDRYQDSGQPSEKQFKLENPVSDLETNQENNGAKQNPADEDMTSRQIGKGSSLGQRITAAPARMMDAFKKVLR